MARRTGTLLIAALAGFAILVSLGMWQLHRLSWKEGLIAERTARLAMAPAPVADVIAAARAGEDVDHRPVTLTGSFGASSLRLFTTRGGSGWEIVSPFTTREGEVVLVDRGILADEKRDAIPAPPAGEVTLTGLAREHPGKGAFTPPNNAATNQWFWFDVPAMTTALTGKSVAPDAVAPVVVDLATPSPEGLTALKPVIDLPNRHLEYALTWFALAATLVGVTAAYLWTGRTRPPGAA
ncbi:MAG: SURF1 family protein [Hyphomicrobiales bacterium]